MVFIDNQHKSLKSMLGLKTLLGGFALFLSFFIEDGLLGLIAVLLLIDLDLHGDEVCLNTLDHMLVLALLHQFKVTCLLDVVHLLLGVHDAVRFLINVVFDVVLFILVVFEFSFYFL
jgi:hypothetical protein